ncbi:hypothetical protein ACIBTV_27775 [Micromonospora sp. NPDC049366]|uniref:hypothetical protein n=1 Tax=Micromonospora sp. NPDC049366 TaxID=3364271 RepID=UPI0037AEB8C6
MSPDELHAAVLSALYAAGAAVADSTPAPWHAGDPPGLRTDFVLSAGQDRRRVADGLSRWDAHLVAALRNTASSAYRGARRIIERHAPRVYGTDWPPCCARCDAPDWPCPDYLDAALVVPNLPEEVGRALRAL